ncbi:MAG: hypothetical protein LBK75_04890, partial [Oscillospiraceae bacterium]|nr:hypothetical protein [Oscillospiraceae bacterium]
MKKIGSRHLQMALFTLLSAILLTGCAPGHSETNTFVPEDDFQYTYYAQGTPQMMAETENGYYILL